MERCKKCKRREKKFKCGFCYHCDTCWDCLGLDKKDNYGSTNLNKRSQDD